MSYRLLVRAIVIHRPDFFVPSAAANKKYLALRNSLNAATKTEDDLVGKFVSDDADGVVGSGILILLAQHLRRGDVLYVIQPALHRDVIACDSQIAKR